MISPISFTSTYRVNNKDYSAFDNFQTYARNREDLEGYKGVKTFLKDRLAKKAGGGFEYKAEQTLIVPDSMDDDVETYCSRNNISYKKFSTKDLLKTENIISRISAAPNDYMKVLVDAERLENLAENQSTNFEHCKSDYDKYYAEKVDTMIKSGYKIPATTLYVDPKAGYLIYGDSAIKDLKHYIDTYGIENLNPSQIGIDFAQRTNKPDHCVYFALRDLGMKEIPVYVNKRSYETGKVLGLFK